MKAHLCLLFTYLILIAVGHADPSPDAELFLAVPGATLISPCYSNNPIPLPENIAPGLRKLVEHYDWGIGDGSAPKKLEGFLYDLKQDGVNVYFINCPAISGSGGPGYFIFRKFQDIWREIGSFQGALYLYPAKPGEWPLLVYTTRGGGESYAKVYFKFINGTYQDTFWEHYDHGVITWTK